MKSLSSEEILLLSAKSDVSDAVDVCMRLLTKASAENDYELSWFLDEFRIQFNRRIQELSN